MNTGITAEALQSLGFLAETGYFFPIPPFPPNDDPLQWRKMGESLLAFLTDGKLHPAVNAWAAMATAFRGERSSGFQPDARQVFSGVAARPAAARLEGEGRVGLQPARSRSTARW